MRFQPVPICLVGVFALALHAVSFAQVTRVHVSEHYPPAPSRPTS